MLKIATRLYGKMIITRTGGILSLIGKTIVMLNLVSDSSSCKLSHEWLDAIQERNRTINTMLLALKHEQLPHR